MFTSMKQKKEEEKIEARKKIGLTEQPIDIKDSSKDPTTRFVENPLIYAK